MSRVVLSIIAGPMRGEEFTFTEATVCTIGRGADCSVQLLGDAHISVSRRHCQIDMTPSAIRVRDLGSLNGTYVNGELIGRRPLCSGPVESPSACGPEVLLNEGDTIQVGGTLFQVSIEGEEAAFSRTEVIDVSDDREAGLLAGCWAH
jgi:eukaryotic-like serine/threonine-protein kinase